MTKLVRFIIVSVQLMFFFFSVFSLTISYAAEPRPAWQSEWDKTVKAAEEEGALVIYMTQAFEPVFRDTFQKKYPRIKVSMATGRGPELSQRVMRRRLAARKPRSSGAAIWPLLWWIGALMVLVTDVFTTHRRQIVHED